MNRHMQVGIREIYGCDPFSLPEGGAYRFLGLHLEFWYGQEFVYELKSMTVLQPTSAVAPNGSASAFTILALT